MDSPLIVQNLSKIYSYGMWPFNKKYFTAVNNISFEIRQSEILGLLGANGAGKTTTIQMLLDLLTPTSGKITYFNKDLSTHRAEILKTVTFASGYEKLPPRLTIWENLDIYGRLYGVPDQERASQIESLLKFFGMYKLKNKPTGMLSAGQMTRVILAKAFIPRPAIVLLDEPTASLDPDVALDVRKFILEQRQQYGVSILFTSHNMTEVTQLCDRILMLKDGSIVADDTPEKLAASVSTAHVHLIISEGFEIFMEYLQQRELPFKQIEQEIIVDIDEHKIGDFLVSIARRGINYSQISIEKPTLEDYFLSKVKSL